MKFLTVILSCFFISNVVFAEDATVEMLNKLDKRSMVFSEEIVRVDVGNKVFWKATDPGHNVEFISKNGVPEGVEKFKSKVGKDIFIRTIIMSLLIMQLFNYIYDFIKSFTLFVHYLSFLMSNV